MAWGSPPPSRPDAEEERGNKNKFAVPPACPRCELTKGQMNRTIQNYQKAYRKKVEGLKQELGTVRADNQHLRSQVRKLRRKRLLHAPSMVVGASLGFLAHKLVQLWRQRQRQQQQPAVKPQEQQQAQQDAQQEEAPAPEQNGVSAS